MISPGMKMGNEMASLCELVADFPCSVASDPRDRFYAFLGLVQEKDEPQLQPDYSESVQATYLRFARHFLLGDGSRGNAGAMPLVEAGTTRHGDITGLPTWISDYSFVPNSRIFVRPGHKHGVYRAAGGTSREIRGGRNVREISVTAGFIDTISQVMPQPEYQRAVGGEFERFFAQIDKLTVLRETAYPYLTPGETHEDVRWRTLIANVNAWGQVADESFGSTFEEDRKRLEEAEDVVRWELDHDNVDRVLSLDWGLKWLSFARDYSVCETASGLVGLVPNGTEVGDSIWVVLGETMPLVLRRSQGDWTKYALYGACYIRGIMDGQALASKHWQEEEICLV